MFTLKSRSRFEEHASAAPYPSWSAVVDAVGYRTGSDEPECRTLREARLWQALADEPVSPESGPTTKADAATPQRR